ncbi:DUF1161 domain-containing protein [Pseudomonas sp. NA-150]|uniref:DUF1161 domain-containing protein n=1 Tax=Pseudomonas sp. NA-150 TaxID=3367525 RepID=UPI0037C54D78
MKRIVLALMCATASINAFAKPLSCEALKQRIEAKIQARNVTSYTLEIVSNADVHDQNMVVGSCDGGTRKIIYQKNDK